MDKRKEREHFFKHVSYFQKLQSTSMQLLRDVEEGRKTWEDVAASMSEAESQLIEKMNDEILEIFPERCALNS